MAVQMQPEVVSGALGRIPRHGRTLRANVVRGARVGESLLECPLTDRCDTPRMNGLRRGGGGPWGPLPSYPAGVAPMNVERVIVGAVLAGGLGVQWWHSREQREELARLRDELGRVSATVQTLERRTAPALELMGAVTGEAGRAT